MFNLPDDSKPVEKADKVLITRYEVFRSPLGVADSNILIDLGFGKLTGEHDAFGNPTMDLFEGAGGTFVNAKFGLLLQRLTKAVQEGKITQEQLDAQVAALLALDAANQAGVEAFIMFCQEAGLIKLPERVVR